jgi:hypothetical protein
MTDSTDDLAAQLEEMADIPEMYSSHALRTAATRLRTLSARALPKLPEGWFIMELSQDAYGLWDAIIARKEKRTVDSIEHPSFFDWTGGEGETAVQAVTDAITYVIKKSQEQDHGS